MYYCSYKGRDFRSDINGLRIKRHVFAEFNQNNLRRFYRNHRRKLYFEKFDIAALMLAEGLHTTLYPKEIFSILT